MAWEQAADPRRRVFVLFLDTWHTTFAGAVYDMKAAHRHAGAADWPRGPLRGDDARHGPTPCITFARRTETLDNALRRETQWGMRDNMVMIDPGKEQALEQCFPEGMPSRKCLGPGNITSAQPADAYRGIAKQLIRRRREKEVLDALEDSSASWGRSRRNARHSSR